MHQQHARSYLSLMCVMTSAITGLKIILKKEKYIMFIIGLLYISLNNVINVIKMFETETKRLLDSLKQKENQE